MYDLVAMDGLVIGQVYVWQSENYKKWIVPVELIRILDEENCEVKRLDTGEILWTKTRKLRPLNGLNSK
ncbi:MAG: hypothetical protein QXX30_00385 [Candidatus Aenigmatarchaeota archaeon]